MNATDDAPADLFTDLTERFGAVPMTITDLATYTGHSQRSVRRWITQFNLRPAAKSGRANYYWLADILKAERDTRYNQQHKVIPEQR